MSETKKDETKGNEETATVQIVGLFMFVWIVLGLAAFVLSLIHISEPTRPY